jgi:hypothetical protein
VKRFKHGEVELVAFGGCLRNTYIMRNKIRLAWLRIALYEAINPSSLINMLGILCTKGTSHFFPDNPAGRFPCSLCVQTLELYLNSIEALCHGPEFRGQVNSHNRAGGNSYSSF